MKKAQIKLLIVLSIIVIIAIASLFIINNLNNKQNINISDERNDIINSIESKQLTFNGVQLTDSTNYNSITNTCTANRYGMEITINNCLAQDIDGKNIKQDVKFKWSGVNTKNISWIFVYENDLESGKIELLQNISRLKSKNVNTYVNNYLVDKVTSYINLTQKPNYCDLGNLNNSRYYSVNRTTNNATQYTQIVCFSDITTVNSTSFRISGNADILQDVLVYEEKYKDVTSQIQFLGKGLLNDTRSYYKVNSVEFSPNEVLNTKWEYTQIDNSKTGKWHILGYDTNTGLINAVATDQYIYIDPWWSASWTKKKAIYLNVTFTPENQTSTLINVTYDSDMQADFDDLRFLDSSESTELGYWFYNNTYLTSNSVQVWLNTSYLNSTSNKTIYMYYSNTGASTTSNIDKAFMFADDFNGSSVDFTSRWVSTNQGLYNVANGILNITGTATTTQLLCSNETFAGDYLVQTRSAGGDTTAGNSLYHMPARTTRTYGVDFADTNTNQFRFQMNPSEVKGGSPSSNVFYLYNQQVPISGTANWSVLSDNKVTLYGNNQSLTQYSGYLCYLEYTAGYKGSIDWLFLRRLTPMEPIISFGTEENSASPALLSNVTISPTNNSYYVPSASYRFNVTIQLTNKSNGISFNGINYTLTNVSNNYTKIFTDLGVGTYPYYFWAYGNDSGNIYAQTTLSYYTIQKSPTQVRVYINNSRSNLEITNGTSIYLNVSASNITTAISLYINDSKINTGVPPLYNITQFNNTGEFIILSNYSGNQNYTSSSESWTLTVNSDQSLSELRKHALYNLSTYFTIENLTFTGNQNITRYIVVPEDTYLTNAQMNLSGFESSNSLINLSGFSISSVTGALSQLYYNNTAYFITDTSSDEVFITDNQGTLISQFDTSIFGANSPTGIWANSSNILFVDATSLRVYKTDLSGNHISNFSISSYISSGPRGLFANNSNIWIVDGNINTIVKTNLNGNYVSNFSVSTLNSTEPYGLWGNSSNLIFTDLLKKFIYITDYNGNLLNSFNVTNLAPTSAGLTGNSTNLFLGSSSADYITKLGASRLLLNISINNNELFYYPDYFIQSNNRTNNFASTVNNYLTSCTYSGGFCYVPIKFHSDSAGILRYSDLNFSSGTAVLTQNYSSNTYETKYETFNISVSFLEGSELSLAKLVYNGVEYAVSNITTNGTFATLTKSINIPLNTNPFANQTNQFYWKFTYDGGITESLDNSSQNVGFINLQNCNATYNQKALNFTFYDESNQTYLNSTINPTTLLVNFNYWLGDGTIKKEYSYQALSSSNNSFQFCSFPNQTLYTDMDMQYSATNYEDRSYYFRSKSINQTQENILLYLLLSSETTKFSVSVKEGTEVFQNGLVEVWKYFVGLGEYKLTMIGLTDDKGKFVANLDLDEQYIFSVSKEGVSYGNYTKQSSCASAPCEIDINLDEIILDPYQAFYEYYAQNIDYSYYIDKNLSTIYINFTDNTGTAQYWRLWVYKAYAENDTLLTVCDEKSYTSIGSLSCNYTGYYGDLNAKVYISRSPEKLVEFINIVNENASSIFSTSGLLASLIIILVIIFSGVRNPVNVLILMPLGIIVMKFLGFLPLSWGWIVGFTIFCFWIITRLKT